MFTGTGSWRVGTADNSDVLSPLPGGIAFTPQEFDGCSNSVAPLRINRDVAFILADDARIRGLTFNLGSGGFTGTDLTLLVPHLFEGKTIVDWTYQQKPFSVIWMALSDGSGLAFTYLPEQEVFAFARVETDGDIERVLSTEGLTEDFVYFAVNRNLNGVNTRSIEYLDNRQFTDVREAYFVDSGVSFNDPFGIFDISLASEAVFSAANNPYSDGDYIYLSDIEGPSELNGKYYEVSDRTALDYKLKDIDTGAYVDTSASDTYVELSGRTRKGVTTVSGLDRLDGMEVSVVADGQQISDPLGDPSSAITVSGGSITLPSYFSIIHVGLPIECDIQTLPFTAQMRETAQSKKKTNRKLYLRVKDAVLDRAGPSEDNLKPIKQRQSEDWREPTQPATDDIEHPNPGDWDRKGQIWYKHTIGLPVTMLAFITESKVGS
jgi:hypothetical protein